MSRLGTERLGSTQFAQPTPFIPEERPARERAEGVIKSAFPTYEGSTWDDLLHIILWEYEIEHEVLADIAEQRFVGDATNRQLDMLGETWGVDRREGERDEHLRARVRTQLPRHTSRATIDEIVAVSAQLLDCERERITVEENFDIEPARFDVYAEDIVFHDAGIDEVELETLLGDIKAAGVNAMTTVGKQFTYRGISDFEDGNNDPERGYDDYAPADVDGYDPANPSNDSPATLDGDESPQDVGAEYADEITATLT